MKHMTGICLMLFTACMLSPALADEIHFTNGERLIGKVVTMHNNKVEFISETAGKVVVDLQKVLTITTDTDLELQTAGDSVIKSRNVTNKNGTLSITATDTKEHSMALGDLTAINPPRKPAVTWTRSVTAGLTSSHGNSSNTNGNVAVNISRRSAKHRFRIDGLYLYGREDNPDADDDPDADEEVTVEENFTVSAKYDYFFTSALYGFLSGSFKKDHIADLDYRIITSSGLGYQWFDSDIFSFSTDAGISLKKEKYTTRVEVNDEDDEEDDDSGNEEPAPVYRREVDRTNDLAIQLGCSLRWKPTDSLHLLGNATYTPSIDDFSDYFLTADAELRAAINKRLFSSFKIILDYDATTAEGVGSTELKYIFGLGLNF